MLCVVIKGPTYLDAKRQIEQACKQADLIELRLDFFDAADYEAICELAQKSSLPSIITLRAVRQGGKYSNTELERQKTLKLLAALKPAYIDLESHLPQSFIEEIKNQNPETKIILSHHDFKQIPEDLDQIYLKMKKSAAALLKLAITPLDSVEMLRFINWSKDKKVMAIGMGKEGEPARILSPIVGNEFTYTFIEESAAPGQLALDTLVNRYNYRKLHKDSKIFGLIGNPVDKSISDETHNSLFQNENWNAVYVKMAVKPEALADFLHYARQLPISGLSVSMPLKEEILNHLDEIDSEAKAIGAVNTLVFFDGKIKGYNTDGLGALNALGTVARKKLVLLGAGGAARAIAFEACRRGAEVIILNRSPERAEALANRFNCQFDALEKLSSLSYDILINSTPVMPIDPEHILPGIIAMDIQTRPKVTSFLQAAAKKDCRLIFGYQMFVEQAIGQFNLWFKPSNLPQIKAMLMQHAQSILLASNLS